MLCCAIRRHRLHSARRRRQQSLKRVRHRWVRCRPVRRVQLPESHRGRAWFSAMSATHGHALKVIQQGQGVPGKAKAVKVRAKDRSLFDADEFEVRGKAGGRRGKGGPVRVVQEAPSAGSQVSSGGNRCVAGYPMHPVTWTGADACWVVAGTHLWSGNGIGRRASASPSRNRRRGFFARAASPRATHSSPSNGMCSVVLWL